MDEERAQLPPPVRIADYDEEVRQFLHALDHEDLERLQWLLKLDPKKIARFEQWDETLTWLSKTGRVGRAIFYVALALLGAIVTIRTVWDLFFPKGST